MERKNDTELNTGLGNKRFHRLFLRLYAVLAAAVAVLILLIGVQPASERVAADPGTKTQYITAYTYSEYHDSTAPAELRRVYSFNLPEIEAGDTIFAVYMIHQYGTVYIDGEARIELRQPDKPGIGKTPGSNWLTFPLTKEDSGKGVTIVTKPVYRETRRTPLAMRITSGSSLLMDVFRQDFTQMMISVLILALSIAFLGVFLYFRHYDGEPQYLLLYVGIIGVSSALWRFTDLRFMDLLFSGHTRVLSYISQLSLMMTLVPLLVIASTRAEDRYRTFLHGSALGLIGFYLLILFLQLFNIVDLRQFSYGFSFALFLIMLISTLLVVFREVNKDGPVHMPTILVFLVCLGGITIDVTSYYVTQSSTGSIYMLMAFLIVVASLGVYFLRGYLDQRQQIRRQEKELEENRISIMMSQIQPHFLYNSLASIYYLCDDDPQLAKKAIDEFASYLRVNMDSLKKTNNVPFTEELEHIRNYLDLEKLRFDERLNIIYDIETTDFLVPPLSIQPIVENAVRHGIGRQADGGTVSISAYEKEDGWFEVTVEDDGVGFDPDSEPEDRSRSHVGIENVRYRLREMCGGTIDIVSEAGFGTSVTIRVPGGNRPEETQEETS